MATNDAAPPAYEGGDVAPDGLDAEHKKWLLAATSAVGGAESKLREVFLLAGGDADSKISEVKSDPASFTGEKSPVVKALAEALLELAKTESKIASERQAREE